MNIKSLYPKNVLNVDTPTKPLIQWYANIQKKLNIKPYVSIENPDKFVSQIYYKTKDLDIFFFSNSSRLYAFTSDISFNIKLKGKQAWRWNPETGERFLILIANNKLALNLKPSESQLIVFDKYSKGETWLENTPDLSKALDINALWNITFNHVNGIVTKDIFSELMDISKNPKYLNFAGEICYETTLKIDESSPDFIDLGNINGVSELYINDQKVGIVWYGKHLYCISKYITRGDNKLKVIVTTTLGNYCKSLKENEVAQRWTASQPLYPCGMVGPVKFYKK
jgi:hypothetical protein